MTASREVARVKCNTSGEGTAKLPPGMIDLLVVPAAFDALRAGDLSRLTLDQELQNTVRSHLNQYRLLTTALNIREPQYLGIKVTANIVPSEHQRPEVVRTRVLQALRSFISPLAIGSFDQEEEDLLGAEWKGWPFGRDLYVSEIYSIIQRVPGVRHVVDIQLGRRPVIPSRESIAQATLEEPEVETTVERGPELTSVDDRMIRVPADALLCSLDHEVELVDL